MSKRTGASKTRRALIKSLNAKIESLQGQIQDLKFKIEDAEEEISFAMKAEAVGSVESDRTTVMAQDAPDEGLGDHTPTGP